MPTVLTMTHASGKATNYAGGKAALRRAIAERRRAQSQTVREETAQALCSRVLALPAVQAAGTVAVYASYPSEPGTWPLRTALFDRGVRVLLPVLLADGDLDWVVDANQPTSLGPDSITAADVVVCPASAATPEGARLGKGGGSYDRALARLPAFTLSIALVYDDEIVEHLPTEQHDKTVGVIISPRRTLYSGHWPG
ncbi:5-formyltetrahydrofolate cyclo-ligase [soil metagenome]